MNSTHEQRCASPPPERAEESITMRARNKAQLELVAARMSGVRVRRQCLCCMWRHGTGRVGPRLCAVRRRLSGILLVGRVLACGRVARVRMRCLSGFLDTRKE